MWFMCTFKKVACMWCSRDQSLVLCCSVCAFSLKATSAKDTLCYWKIGSWHLSLQSWGLLNHNCVFYTLDVSVSHNSIITKQRLFLLECQQQDKCYHFASLSLWKVPQGSWTFCFLFVFATLILELCHPQPVHNKFDLPILSL